MEAADPGSDPDIDDAQFIAQEVILRNKLSIICGTLDHG